MFMNSPHFSTQAPMRSGSPRIALSSISAEKQHQAEREFSMRVAFGVAGFILSTLYRTIAQRFSMGDRSGMLPDRTLFAQKSEKLSWDHRLVLAAGWARASSFWKMSCDMSGRNLTAALLEAYSPFDAAVPFSTSPRRSPTWQICRKARCRRGQYVTRVKGQSILGHPVLLCWYIFNSYQRCPRGFSFVKLLGGVQIGQRVLGKARGSQSTIQLHW